MNKLPLGKTGDSRTRGKSKEVEAPQELPDRYQPYQEFYHYLLGKGSSTQTALGHLNRAAHFVNWAETENVPVEHVRTADILHYLQSFKKQVKQRTLQSRVNTLRHYYQYLRSTGAMVKNPAGSVKVKGVKRKILYHVLSRQELDSLYEHYPCLAVAVSKRNKVMLGLLVFQGLTTGELSKLTLQDLKLREGKLYVGGSRRSNERILKLESHQILELMEYTLNIRPELLQKTGKNSDRLLISPDETLYNAIRSLLRKLRQQQPKVTNINQLRASVITHWLQQHNLREVQYLAGHRYISSTEAYQVNDLEGLQEEIERCHPL